MKRTERFFVRLAASSVGLLLLLSLSSVSAHAGGWKFIAYGDTRTNDADHRSVLSSMMAHTPDYKFIINVGDVVEDGTRTDLWNIWQKACDDILGGTGQSSVPPRYMAVPGNHEQILTPAGLANWNTYLPGQIQYGNNGKYFVFDYEDARFVLLNTEEITSTSQLQMLLDSLKTNTKKWLFAIWHKPIFDFGEKAYEPAIHTNFGVPLYNNGCDILFLGHSHYYVRSKKLALNGQQNPPLDPERGTAHIVTGNGGAPLDPVDENHDGNGYMVAYSYDQYNPIFYGYTEVNVDGDTLRLKHYSAAGQVMDQEIYTPNPKPLVTPRYHLQVTTVGTGTINWTPVDTSYYRGSKIVFTANTPLGSRFTGWSGGLTGAQTPDTLVITSDTQVTGTFESLPPGTFELRTSYTTGGAIVLDPPGPYYSSGAVVTAAAVAEPGYAFAGWGGVGTGTDDTLRITMDANKALSATFRAFVSNTIAVRSLGLGSVALSPEGGVYPETTLVTVTATPANGWEFVEWTGAINGATNPAVVSMSSPREIKARFRKTGSLMQILLPTDDSWVRGSLYSSNNYGTDSTLRVSEGTSDLYRYRSYLRFSLDSVRTPLLGAVLRLRARADGFPSGGPMRVYAYQTTGDTWTEGTLNWKNVPLQGTLVDSTTAMSEPSMVYAWDVKDYVATELAGDKVLTVLLRDNAGNSKMAVFNSCQSGYAPSLEVESDVTNAADEIEQTVPLRFNLGQNYPNPFNPSTVIAYTVAGVRGQGSVVGVKLAVYDVLGREVALLVNERQAPGVHQVVFNAAGLPSGLYVYRLQASGQTEAKRMMLIK